jgi:hypothetical protein
MSQSSLSPPRVFDALMEPTFLRLVVHFDMSSDFGSTMSISIPTPIDVIIRIALSVFRTEISSQAHVGHRIVLTPE